MKKGRLTMHPIRKENALTGLSEANSSLHRQEPKQHMKELRRFRERTRVQRKHRVPQTLWGCAEEKPRRLAQQQRPSYHAGRHRQLQVRRALTFPDTDPQVPSCSPVRPRLWRRQASVIRRTSPSATSHATPEREKGKNKGGPDGRHMGGSKPGESP